MKLEPWSDWTDWGSPKSVKKLISTYTILGALIFQRGKASGNRVFPHIIAKRYWLPSRVLGSGPTQSIITWENGSPATGMGFKGATAGFWLGFPTD